MASTTQIRTGLETRLALVTSPVQLHAFDVQPDKSVRTPAAIVFPRSCEQQTAGDGFKHQFVIEVWVAIGDSVQRAQALMDSLIDPLAASGTGIRKTIEAARTLGLSGVDARVLGHTGYRFGQLNTEGPPNALVAHIGVQVLA